MSQQLWWHTKRNQIDYLSQTTAMQIPMILLLAHMQFVYKGPAHLQNCNQESWILSTKAERIQEI